MDKSTFTFTLKTNVSLPNLKEFQAKHVKTMLRSIVEEEVNELAIVCSLSTVLSNFYRHETWAKALLQQFGGGMEALDMFKKNTVKLLKEVIEKEAGGS